VLLQCVVAVCCYVLQCKFKPMIQYRIAHNCDAIRAQMEVCCSVLQCVCVAECCCSVFVLHGVVAVC